MNNISFEELSTQCLSFPKQYFINKNITSDEIIQAKELIIKVLNDKLKPSKLDKPYCSQLINVVALANRIPRIKRALEYILSKFNKYLVPKYFSAYNLVFLGAVHFGYIIGSDSPLKIASEILFKTEFDKTNEEQKIKCVNFAITVKEIFAVSQLIRSELYYGGPLYITHIYNLLDKFNYIFRSMFKFNVFDVYKRLSPHRYARNSIAHSHFVIDKERDNKLKTVIWKKENGQLNANGFLEDTLGVNIEQIRLEMLYLCVIICQILLLYQLFFQTK